MSSLGSSWVNRGHLRSRVILGTFCFILCHPGSGSYWHLKIIVKPKSNSKSQIQVPNPSHIFKSKKLKSPKEKEWDWGWHYNLTGHPPPTPNFSHLKFDLQTSMRGQNGVEFYQESTGHVRFFLALLLADQWEAKNPNFLVIWPTDKYEGSKWGRILPGIHVMSDFS